MENLFTPTRLPHLACLLYKVSKLECPGVINKTNSRKTYSTTTITPPLLLLSGSHALLCWHAREFQSASPGACKMSGHPLTPSSRSETKTPPTSSSSSSGARVVGCSHSTLRAAPHPCAPCPVWSALRRMDAPRTQARALNSN